MTRNALLSEVRQLIPPLSSELHKGQAGRVGIVGGSADYTGAPYFAAMSSMRLGADMSHNICEPSAGDVIKTYSPDLIVHRILGTDRSLGDIRKDIEGIVDRLHALAVGPGLGRDEHMQACAKVAMQAAIDKQIYLIVDADGLWLLQNEPDVVKGYKRCVLTPNVVEFGRLCQKLGIELKGSESDEKQDEALKLLAQRLSGPTILLKGKIDRITDGRSILYVSEPGGLKRCGGQGDILTGSLSTFLAWASVYQSGVGSDTKAGKRIDEERLPMLAAYGASTIMRTVSNIGFKTHKRALLAHDLLDQVGVAYEKHFGEGSDTHAAL
ncbi:Ribokinase-like protein [Acaromyces ingoldii]|uniref:ATP-dependent (S)-NAD(P)H-hydrate dehydratase n=1 Tax=Acaromyces ingoldii TaxID=215250 RepID=A0A316YII9_9BASI|nr:Ribokinase-like protein [Acaromyces ingoldii]PWN89019.1 Ribokinase-like protein [Acaromyces ingoldii]